MNKGGMNKQKTIQCPVCCGVGKIEIQIMIPKKQMKEAIKTMRKEGVSLKKIAEKLGLSGPSGVSFYLN